MHEVHELERRWLRYKIKKIILPLFIFLAIVLILVVSYFLYQSFLKTDQSSSTRANENKSVTAAINNEEIPKKQKLEKKEPIINEVKNITPANTNTNKIQITAYEPDLSMFKDEDENEVDKNTKEKQQPQKIQESTTSQETADINQKPKQQSVEKNSKTTANDETISKNNVNLRKSKNLFDPLEYEKKFYETNQIKYALFLANYYYDNNNYEAAHKWAYTINQLDPTNEDGWLFFAKSLYKLDKKEDAVKVLRSYLRHYDSSQAKNLLTKIIQGAL